MGFERDQSSGGNATADQMSTKLKDLSWFERRSNHLACLVLVLVGLGLSIASISQQDRGSIGWAVVLVCSMAAILIWKRTERNYVVKSQKHAWSNAVALRRVHIIAHELGGREMEQTQFEVVYVLPCRWGRHVLLIVGLNEGVLHYNLLSVGMLVDFRHPDLFDLGLSAKKRKRFERELASQLSSTA